MKITIMYCNTANFRGNATMNFAKYWHHHLTLDPADNKKNLDDFVKLVKTNDAGIVGLGEIDKQTHWSARVNQPKYLADLLGYNYVYGRNYDSPLPFLYTADTGNAVLSRFPIDEQNSKIKAFAYKNIFEIVTTPIGRKRFIHSQHALPNGKNLHVVCTHLSVSFKKLREKSAEDLVRYFKENIIPFHESRGDPYILMGDLNTIPLYTAKKYGFVDEDDDDAFVFELGETAKKVFGVLTKNIEDLLKDSLEFSTKFVTDNFPDDYREDKTLKILGDSGYFKSTMKQNPFNANEKDSGRYLTYPARIKKYDCKRMIDYIFVSPDMLTTDIDVLNSKVSDHEPIKTVVELPD